MLPHDALTFLADGRSLQYDVNGSEIGAVQLKGVGDLTPSTVRMPVYREHEVEDPYNDLDGHYLVDIVDIIAESEDYDPRGLLCWFPRLQAYGSIDPEHGAILMFPGASWQDIVATPADYLDAQWNPDSPVASLVYAWRYFSFQLADSTIQLPPYTNVCPVHGTELIALPLEKPNLLDVYRLRHLDEWLRSHLSAFPNAGVPDEDHKLVYCAECRESEYLWLKQKQDAIIPLEATPNQAGFVLCPGCQTRFSINDRNRFENGVHLSCGQKVLVKLS